MIHLLFSKNFHAIFLSLILLFLAGALHAQEMKLGKIDKVYLQMTRYEKDTAAEAVVLADVGKTYFTFHQTDGFQVIFERHVRIKIFNNKGYEWANEEISVYNNSDGKESITGLKGFTYNLKGGKVVREKLGKEHIYEEQVSEHWDKIKFTMPKVQEGSVVEYTYKIRSDFLVTLRTWQFQKSIPVLWSDYTVKAPEYFNYLTIASGYEPFFINENGRESGTLMLNSKERAGNGRITMTNYESSNVDYMINTYHWVAKDMPAIREEKYITTTDDYALKMELQLASTQYPGSVIENILGTWEEIDQKLLAHSDFGKQFNRSNFFEDELAKVTAGLSDPKEKMIAIYQYVIDNFRWNGKKKYLAGDNLKKIFEQKEGTSAELNLLFIAMLKEAGLKANPVIMSTRDNGKIHYTYPILSKFNYVIAHVAINDKTYLLDGTNPLVNYDMLPPKCLNRRGRLISENNSRWVDIKPTDKFSTFTSAQFKISEKGELTGVVKISNGGYNGLVVRESLKNLGEEKYIEEFKTNFDNWDIKDFEINNMEKIAGPMDEVFNVTYRNSTPGTDILYLNPILIKEEGNPFLVEKRKYPVDLASTIEQTYRSSYLLPEEYQVDEIPQPAIFTLPGNAARFHYQIQVSANIINVLSKISINKDLFLPEEYPHLRKFYSMIVAKQAEQLVLKKVN